MLFYCLVATADDLNMHIGVDQEGYQDWYLTLKKEFTTEATKAMAAEVDKKWLHWKAEHLKMLAHQHEKEIAAQARNWGIAYFISTRQRQGLHITCSADTTNANPTPTMGRKRMASGSLPRQRLSTLTTRETTQKGSHTASLDTPRRRLLTLTNKEHMQVDPPSPEMVTPIPAWEKKGSMDLDSIAAVIKAVLSPTIQAAMAPYVAKITALEKRSNPTVADDKEYWPNITNPAAPRGMEGSVWATVEPVHPKSTDFDDFTPVTRSSRGRRMRSKVGNTNPASTLPPRENLKPASYATAAATAANTRQPTAPPKQPPHIPTITEVTIIRSGGVLDTVLEETIRA